VENYVKLCGKRALWKMVEKENTFPQWYGENFYQAGQRKNSQKGQFSTLSTAIIILI